MRHEHSWQTAPVDAQRRSWAGRRRRLAARLALSTSVAGVVVHLAGANADAAEPAGVTNVATERMGPPTPSLGTADATTAAPTRTTAPLPSLGGAEATATLPGERTAATPDRWLVTNGDSLWTIATAALLHQAGDSDAGAHPSVPDIAAFVAELWDLNRTTVGNPDLIRPGQTLLLPAAN